LKYVRNPVVKPYADRLRLVQGGQFIWLGGQFEKAVFSGGLSTEARGG